MLIPEEVARMQSCDSKNCGMQALLRMTLFTKLQKVQKVFVLAEDVWQSTELPLSQLTLSRQLTNLIIGATLSKPHTSVTALYSRYLHLLGPTTHGKF